MNNFSSACDAFRTKKTEIMFQAAPHITYSYPSITLKGPKLQTVDRFTYVGSTLSRNVLIDDEVDAIIANSIGARGSKWTCLAIFGCPVVF